MRYKHPGLLFILLSIYIMSGGCGGMVGGDPNCADILAKIQACQPTIVFNEQATCSEFALTHYEEILNTECDDMERTAATWFDVNWTEVSEIPSNESSNTTSWWDFGKTTLNTVASETSSFWKNTIYPTWDKIVNVITTEWGTPSSWFSTWGTGSSSIDTSSLDAQALATIILDKCELMDSHITTQDPGSTALRNIQDIAAGKMAKRSIDNQRVAIDVTLLRFVASACNQGFRLRITEFVGGTHTKASKHYVGKAVDIDKINNIKVMNETRYNSTILDFISYAKDNGVTCILELGDPGTESGHLHCSVP